MKKGSVITISIFTLLIALSIILFGCVFCVRKQTVTCVNTISITEQEILDAANIKNGKPILLLDKEVATQNIEKKYPNVKVIQIKTTSLTEIEIVIRERFSLYYTESNEKFYILDEELKVLDILNEEPTNLIKITNDISIAETTEKADFIVSGEDQEIYYNLFVSMYSVVLNSEDNQARVDMANLISTVNLNGNKLTIITKDEVTLEIEKPNKELTNKINICFSAIEELQEDQKSKTTIKIIYNLEETEYKGYVNIAD